MHVFNDVLHCLPRPFADDLLFLASRLGRIHECNANRALMLKVLDCRTKIATREWLLPTVSHDADGSNLTRTHPCDGSSRPVANISRDKIVAGYAMAH